MPGPNLSSDLDVLTATVYGEGRNQSILGLEAIASVVLNRAEYAAKRHRPQFGNGSIRSACLAPWQFSCWNDGDPNRAVIETLDFTQPRGPLLECLTVASKALDGMLDDPTDGCRFYKVTDLPWPGDWGAEVPPVVTIGAHSFYKLP